MDKARKKPGSESKSDATGKVFIVEDDAVSRQYLTELVSSVGLQAEAFDSAEAFLKFHKPEMGGCLLLDVRMPGMSGLELQEKLRQEQLALPVIIITAHADVPMAVRAMRSGAMDFIEKPIHAQTLLERIDHAIKKDRDYRRDMIQMQKIQKSHESLTDREKEVFARVASGLLNKQIASELDLSIKTIEVHRSRVMEKMQAESLADLVRMASAMGINSDTAPKN